MHHRYRQLLVLSIAVVAAGCLPQRRSMSTDTREDRADRLSGLDQLVGTWVSEHGRVRTEEHWLLPAGNVMLGINRTIRNGETGAYEYLRIEKGADGITYTASPSGQRTTSFALIESNTSRYVFENPKHDFPQRIIYERAGDRLVARIEGMRRGKPASAQWEFVRVK